MKLKVIGCGSALDVGTTLGNQSFLLEHRDEKMLIDCGRTTPEMLKRAGIDVKDITYIYISHLHNDHCGGLEWVALSRYDWLKKPTHASEFENCVAPILVGNRQVIDELWNSSLKGGLNTMAGFESNLETFFKIETVSLNENLIFGGVEINLIQQVHIMAGNIILPSYGLFINGKKQKMYLTTDAQYFQPEQVRIFYDKADTIIQDCECIGVDTVELTMDFKSGVHANYAQLAGWESANAMKLSQDIKNKIWLSHYQDFVTKEQDYKGNHVIWDSLAKVDSLAGFLKVGQEFEI
jgi:ribonuclease BN (tRNA processing enzyme)